MILKVNDTDYAQISMELSVDFNHADLTIWVKYWNKLTHKRGSKPFKGNELAAAKTYYAQLESLLI